MTKLQKPTNHVGPEDLLQQWPQGKSLWMRVRGRSMYPVLWSGQSLKVVACRPEDVAVGDIAVGRLPGGIVAAHVVVQVAPPRMSSFAGRLDPAETLILGKAVAVRTRAGRVFPLTRVSRSALFFAQNAYRFIRTSAAAPLFRKVRSGLSSPITAPFRKKWLSPVEVRPLRPDDLEEVLVFTGDQTGLHAGMVHERLTERWQREGRAAGAFARNDKMVAFCYLDEYASEGAAVEGVWLRFLVTSPMARGMGLAKQVVMELVNWAARAGFSAVHADVLAHNKHSLRVFRSLGFHEVDGPIAQQVRAHHARTGNAGEWVVFAKTLAVDASPGK